MLLADFDFLHAHLKPLGLTPTFGFRLDVGDAAGRRMDQLPDHRRSRGVRAEDVRLVSRARRSACSVD